VLEVHGRLDVHDNPVAKQVHRLMKERRLTGWSFGYTVPPDGQQRRDGVNEVSEVDLVEVGPTLKGANPEAQLQAVKTALREANGDSGFEAMRSVDRQYDEESRKRMRSRERDAELEELVKEYASKPRKPITVKTFRV
jgi:phage head maturation protease